MSTETDAIDTAMQSLKTAIANYRTATGGAGFGMAALGPWVLSQMKQADPSIAGVIDRNTHDAAPPDRRAFTQVAG